MTAHIPEAEEYVTVVQPRRQIVAQLWWCTLRQHFRAAECQCNAFQIDNPCGWVEGAVR